MFLAFDATDLKATLSGDLICASSVAHFILDKIGATLTIGIDKVIEIQKIITVIMQGLNHGVTQ
jgi:hypothetical protein